MLPKAKWFVTSYAIRLYRDYRVRVILVREARVVDLRPTVGLLVCSRHVKVDVDAASHANEHVYVVVVRQVEAVWEEIIAVIAIG